MTTHGKSTCEGGLSGNNCTAYLTALDAEFRELFGIIPVIGDAGSSVMVKASVS